MAAGRVWFGLVWLGSGFSCFHTANFAAIFRPFARFGVRVAGLGSLEERGKLLWVIEGGDRWIFFKFIVL